MSLAALMALMELVELAAMAGRSFAKHGQRKQGRPEPLQRRVGLIPAKFLPRPLGP